LNFKKLQVKEDITASAVALQSGIYHSLKETYLMVSKQADFQDLKMDRVIVGYTAQMPDNIQLNNSILIFLNGI
jgi:hypothetical protein